MDQVTAVNYATIPRSHARFSPLCMCVEQSKHRVCDHFHVHHCDDILIHLGQAARRVCADLKRILHEHTGTRPLLTAREAVATESRCYTPLQISNSGPNNDPEAFVQTHGADSKETYLAISVRIIG